MKILIFGHDDKKQLFLQNDEYELTYMDIRVDDVEAVITLIETTRPDRVVNINVDCFHDDLDLELNIRNNLYGPLTIANACASHGIHFSHVNGNSEHASQSIVQGFTNKLLKQMCESAQILLVNTSCNQEDIASLIINGECGLVL